MGFSYRDFAQLDRQRKYAAAVMTPEAMQAAQQPPMDPSMMGGAPQGAPMDPSMMGGMPPEAAMGGAPMPADQMQGAPTGPQGGQIPPEILQDQGFIQFLMQVAGIQLDPAAGVFVGPDGQPVPAEMIIQAYSEYQNQMAMQQQQQQQGAPMDPSMMGGMPPEAAMGAPAGAGMPMGPSMAGMDPSMMGGAPMDPSMMGGMPPEAATGEAAPAIPDEIMNQISSAVMSGIESVLQDFSQELGKKFQELNDKIDKLAGDFGTLTDTDDRRKQEDLDELTSLRDEIEADLNPVKQASVLVTRGPVMPLNIFDLIANRGL